MMCKIDIAPMPVIDYLCLTLQADTINEEIWKMSVKEETRHGFRFRTGIIQRSDGAETKKNCKDSHEFSSFLPAF